jgi:hypothetical protein
MGEHSGPLRFDVFVQPQAGRRLRQDRRERGIADRSGSDVIAFQCSIGLGTGTRRSQFGCDRSRWGHPPSIPVRGSSPGRWFQPASGALASCAGCRVPPERLLRALLLQAFYTIRSETQLMEQLDYNLRQFGGEVGYSPGVTPEAPEQS